MQLITSVCVGNRYPRPLVTSSPARRIILRAMGWKRGAPQRWNDMHIRSLREKGLGAPSGPVDSPAEICVGLLRLRCAQSVVKGERRILTTSLACKCIAGRKAAVSSAPVSTTERVPRRRCKRMCGVWAQRGNDKAHT
ncbi:hypothetical protein C8Q78DRAFT_251413 [Trametes maxima]|nr:hypothetical protein C8Q78DRAFT_251413 [Trametes maxima]